MEETKDLCTFCQKRFTPDEECNHIGGKCKKELNLSDREISYLDDYGKWINSYEKSSVKEFIRKEDQLIQDYAQGRISYPELIMKRDKLIGEGLK